MRNREAEEGKRKEKAREKEDKKEKKYFSQAEAIFLSKQFDILVFSLLLVLHC